jgi:hypothetical protein
MITHPGIEHIRTRYDQKSRTINHLESFVRWHWLCWDGPIRAGEQARVTHSGREDSRRLDVRDGCHQSEFHTLVWPNGADFASEFLHDNIRVTA